MMKKIILSLLMLIPGIAMANQGYYIQGEGGLAADNGFFFPGYAGRLSTGYLWGDNNFNYGVEVGGLYDRGIYNSNDSTFNGYNADLLGVVKYTFANANDPSGFTLFAKAGVAYVYQTFSFSFNDSFENGPNNETFKSSMSGFGPEVALGMGYQFNANFETDLTGSVAFPVVKGGVANVDTILLGLTYHFA